jgi:uncharacterized protein YxeA
MNNMENKEKMTFLQWVDNTWYHYKPQIIIGFFAIVLLVTCVIQFSAKKDPDVFVYYVGEGNITVEAAEKFRTDMESILEEDYNGDGHKTVDYKEDVFVMYSADGETENNTYVYNSTEQMNIVKRFNMELGMGDCVVYIMDPNLYKANKDYILALEDSLGYIPEFAYDDKGIKVSDLPAYRLTGLAAFPENYVICVRAKRTMDNENYYNGNVEFFRTLVEYN